jgi:hypothetical protein
MPRLGKSKSLADPVPPSELVQQLASQRNYGVLAASSTAIALSIGSPLYDTGDTSSDGAGIQGRDTGWQTAYAAARMVVEITKESSDLFPPLKAVVGAVSVLIKNCDVGVPLLRTNASSSFLRLPLQQTSDNAENVEEIERRVHSLSGVLASPVSEDDYAEKGRREELRRFVHV